MVEGARIGGWTLIVVGGLACSSAASFFFFTVHLEVRWVLSSDYMCINVVVWTYATAFFFVFSVDARRGENDGSSKPSPLGCPMIQEVTCD